MVKEKKTKAKAKVSKKAPVNKWWFEDIGDNVRKNAEEISANIRANAEEISANINANVKRIAENINAR
tara:strand:- start:435 stop:638 length:204 start_codon:yes stop_codon:yes gene_type:complete